MNRDSILSKKTVKVEPVDVPEWDGTVYMHGMNGAERLAWGREAAGMAGDGAAVKLVARSARTETGDRLFTDDDGPFLLTLDGVLFERLAMAAFRVNGLTPQQQADAKKN